MITEDALMTILANLSAESAMLKMAGAPVEEIAKLDGAYNQALNYGLSIGYSIYGVSL